ncbi:DNA repair protein rad2 [Elasticomyces elasticus]|uniref:DNA repair protein rad2 n=1 Tax=Exophiala sideris TaxID=1016849 RepID=A0ABR0J2S6_9EURO|nr:DNA repair protein rad2 [Elasticomyces elasticus]KAK5024082.1 DNA repair protein rad2 [Exophiala sideris]KAK5029056.1 DNA repair protein rad2 [Exophiala sideris]KAK5054794.1 DNA repair protein rad2 [Exophiala sideris]KAK5178879.1 DNA repair protein rad2 [Eurotiomycetes sp. CCFEE 6388]
MGVTGLWTVVAPTARPTQLASLNRKRLAVDASIWIYQFLKAVRDKEGNALRNSHVVGFFRRICKLLYFGIKPVFVFDGGAPILKRETIRKRARRREGRREDAARTAGKLLAVQVARAAEEEEKRRRAERERTPLEEELPADQELVYVDELGMTQKERQVGRQFKKKDQYHLPDLDVSIESMGAPNDPRIMSQAELEEYARQFHSGEDVNLYDFSKIDFESPFFLSLPPGDRYNILNAARLRSRLRMGFSKEQLDGMFPDRMAFSKFQIERVRERNELTQRLMHINGMSDDIIHQGGRIAGEKGKEYILVRNDGVDGGWALGVVSNKQGTKRENAIDLEDDENSEGPTVDSAEEEEFEDVAIEGLNRMPKALGRKRKAVDYDTSYDAVEEIAKKRRAVYEARKAGAAAPAPSVREPKAAPTTVPATANVDEDTLFVPEDKDDDDMDELFEDVLPIEPEPEEDDELQRAIAMSLEKSTDADGGFIADDNGNDHEEEDDEDDGFDLQAALAESRKNKHKSRTNVRERSPPPKVDLPAPQFNGPLPFESINLGQSLLGKKKSKRIEEDLSGGFDRELGDDAFRKERPPQPMPAWFNAAPSTKDLKHIPEDVEEEEVDSTQHVSLDIASREKIRRYDTKEVIDLEAEDHNDEDNRPIELEEEEEEDRPDLFVPSQDVPTEPELPMPEDLPEVDEDEEAEGRKREAEREQRYELARQIAAENNTQETLMGDVAEKAQAKPPQPSKVPDFNPVPAPTKPESAEAEPVLSDGDEIAWSESDYEADQPATPDSLGTVQDQPEPVPPAEDEDEDEAFEDVDMEPEPVSEPGLEAAVAPPVVHDTVSAYAEAPAPQQLQAEEDFEYLSESEEELMRQLAIEAEEHARFASSLHNQKTNADAIRDYENELKQLRNQQKKDRRDADEVTQVMVQECQALLRLFGLPYITAPMEAEAQCAELVRLGLVDGIVTDDSDIFLFGGTRIYKNMFNAAKFVECYLSSDMEKEFTLDRRRLIRFAHLLGSDYTEGIPGVGPVTALEILTDFETLSEFKEWCSKVQLGRPADLEDQLTTPFRRKFKNTVQKRLFLPSGFPDVRVDEAYLNPEVDSDPEPFVWGVPDLDKLRGYLMATIGWSQERTDEVLVPVIRDMNKRDVEGTQSNITRFFAGGVGVGGRGIGGAAGSGLAVGGEGPGTAEGMAPRNRTGKESGRMKNAFKRLRGEAERKRKGLDFEEGNQQDEDGQDGHDSHLAVADDADADDGDFAEDEAPKKKTKAKTKGKSKKR